MAPNFGITRTTKPPVAQAGARVTVVIAHWPNQPNGQIIASWVLPGHIDAKRAQMYVLTSEDQAVGDMDDNEFRDERWTWYVDHTVVLT